jgi:hypothetical protein
LRSASTGVELLGGEERRTDRESELLELGFLARRDDCVDDDAVVRVPDLVVEVETGVDQPVELGAVGDDHLDHARAFACLASVRPGARHRQQADGECDEEHERACPKSPPHSVNPPQ